MIYLSIEVTTIGDWDSTTKWLAKSTSRQSLDTLHSIGNAGVNALIAATPKDTGITASSWKYDIVGTGKGYEVIFKNTGHPFTRIPVALLIQYGHGTRTGGYVPPVDYINPALRGIFESAGNKLAKEMFN